jgi:hypothetical protein
MLALVALKQRGKPVSVDAVKTMTARDLPQPSLPGLSLLMSSVAVGSAASPPTGTPPPPMLDPWASASSSVAADLSAHAHPTSHTPISDQISIFQRSTSFDGTMSPDNYEHTPYVSPRRGSSDDQMAAMAKAATGDMQWFLNLNRVKISIAPDKRGIIFKHVEYQVASAQHQTRVLRRYSDFVWLADLLVRRYPFRLVPLLPPKKLGGGVLFVIDDWCLFKETRHL